MIQMLSEQLAKDDVLQLKKMYLSHLKNTGTVPDEIKNVYQTNVIR